MTIDRRGVIGLMGLGAGALGLAPLWPAFAADAAGTVLAPRISDIAVSATRSTKLFEWRPAKPKGVVLFSTGHGSWPERYVLLVDLLTGLGFVVIAPVHVDSMHYADRDKFSLAAGLMERLSDMKAVSALAAQTYPMLPTIAVGHSLGTLNALCLGGAMSKMGKLRNPAVKAVLGFSTPGKIPGLIQPDSYAGLAVPTLIVTGDKDVVPTFAADPADHIFPVQSSPAGAKYALVVAGADHGLVGEAGPFAHVRPALVAFLKGYGLDNAGARRTLAGYHATAGDTFIARDKVA